MTIDKSIASSAGFEHTEIEIETEEEFKLKLGQILSCKKVTTIIKNLLSINKEEIFSP